MSAPTPATDSPRQPQPGEYWLWLSPSGFKWVAKVHVFQSNFAVIRTPSGELVETVPEKLLEYVSEDLSYPWLPKPPESFFRRLFRRLFNANNKT